MISLSSSISKKTSGKQLSLKSSPKLHQAPPPTFLIRHLPENSRRHWPSSDPLLVVNHQYLPLYHCMSLLQVSKILTNWRQRLLDERYHHLFNIEHCSRSLFILNSRTELAFVATIFCRPLLLPRMKESIGAQSKLRSNLISIQFESKTIIVWDGFQLELHSSVFEAFGFQTQPNQIPTWPDLIQFFIWVYIP